MKLNEYATPKHALAYLAKAGQTGSWAKQLRAVLNETLANDLD